MISKQKLLSKIIQDNCRNSNLLFSLVEIRVKTNPYDAFFAGIHKILETHADAIKKKIP